MVKKSALAAMARDLQLGEHLTLGSGELKSGGRDRESIVADALEAVIGSVAVDGGYQAAAEGHYKRVVELEVQVENLEGRIEAMRARILRGES